MTEQQNTTTTTNQAKTQVHHPKARPSASCIPCRNRKVKVPPSPLSVSFSIPMFFPRPAHRNLNTNR